MKYTALTASAVVTQFLFTPTAALQIPSHRCNAYSSNLFVPWTTRNQQMGSSRNILRHRHKVTRRFSELTKDTATPLMEMPETMVTTDAVVCGGGPAGLLSAIMLAQKLPSNQKITVFDRLPPPPSPTDESVWSDIAKFYLIGLGARGQKALAQFGVWNEVQDVCTAVLGRKDWAPESQEGVERIFTDRPVTTQVLPRDKLVGVLHQHILNNYAHRIQLKYEYEVTPLDFNAGSHGTEVVLQINKCENDQDQDRTNPSSVVSGNVPDTLCLPDQSFTLTTNLLIAADGTARTIANHMEENDKEKHDKMNPLTRIFAGKPFHVKRYVDDNQRIYKTIPLRLPPGWRPDLNYSARTKGGRINIDALPANRNGSYCAVLLLKKEDPMSQPDSDPKELRKLFDENLPQFTQLIDDQTMEVIAKKGPSFLPAFRYVGPRLNQDDRTIILGDCAHTVKPYFGLGANSALEDVQVLGDIIDSTSDLTEAVHTFSKQRAGEAKALVKISRELDRPGKLGFITFILPLILDSIFNGIAPKLFAPNTISMLQKEGYNFRRVARRKRNDRLAQIAIITTSLTAMTAAARLGVITLARAMGRRSTTVLGGLTSLIVVASFVKKLTGYLVPGMAPADVLAKTKSMVTNSETIVTSKNENAASSDPATS